MHRNSQVRRAARVLGPVEHDLRVTCTPNTASSRPQRPQTTPRKHAKITPNPCPSARASVVSGAPRSQLPFRQQPSAVVCGARSAPHPRLTNLLLLQETKEKPGALPQKQPKIRPQPRTPLEQPGRPSADASGALLCAKRKLWSLF